MRKAEDDKNSSKENTKKTAAYRHTNIYMIPTFLSSSYIQCTYTHMYTLYICAYMVYKRAHIYIHASMYTYLCLKRKNLC